MSEGLDGCMRAAKIEGIDWSVGEPAEGTGAECVPGDRGRLKGEGVGGLEEVGEVLGEEEAETEVTWMGEVGRVLDLVGGVG
jgi:hypothetical protein